MHAPHQPRREERGGMARDAAGRPAASTVPAGQERSPRPPSGCGGQSSGDSARPGVDSSQLACAAQLSNIHLRGSSPAAPSESQKTIPFGRAFRVSPESKRGSGGDKGACSDHSSSRVPVAPRGKGGSGGLLTRENPRHGRSRLRGARDGARTGVRGRVTEPRRQAGAHACEAEPPLSAGWRGVGGGEFFILFFTGFLRGGGEGSEVWGFSGEKAGRRSPRAGPGTFPIPHVGQVGARRPRELRCWQSASPGQRSLPALRPSSSTAEMPATDD